MVSNIFQQSSVVLVSDLNSPTWLSPGINLWPHQLAAVLLQDRKKVSHKRQVSLPGEAGRMDQQMLLVSLLGPPMFPVKILLRAFVILTGNNGISKSWEYPITNISIVERNCNIQNNGICSGRCFLVTWSGEETQIPTCCREQSSDWVMLSTNHPVGRFAGWSLKWVVLVKSLNGFEGKCLMERFWTYQDHTNILCETTSDILPCRFSLESSHW